MKIYRVVVRGQFCGLSDATRASLLERADDHHFLKSAFTKDGTFTYDAQLVAFNFRYEVRHGEDGPNEDDIGAEAIARTAQRLDDAGVGHKRLRATVTDMASMWSR